MIQTNSPNDPSQPAATQASHLGVDLGGRHIRIGAIDSTGKLLTFRREPYLPESLENPQALTAQIVASVKKIIEDYAAEGNIKSAGISFPGLVNQKTRRVVEISRLPDFSGIDLHSELSKAFGLPVLFENNANSAAYAELMHGVAQGAGDWLYLLIGANVSAGIVLGGKLQRGKSGYCGAIGHMSIDPERSGDSVMLENMVSAENIVRRTRDRLHRDKTSSLSRLGAMGGFSYDDIISAAHNEDDLAKMMLQRTGTFIAMAISDVVSLLNLEMIVVGGAPGSRQFLIPAIAEEASKRTSPVSFSDCRIVPADLGHEAAVIGVAMLSAL
ncbi:MAG: ROK family protein [Acidobacteria bacterium]|nr:ROK family protein [Acidobacteriota bacterium]